MVHVFPVPNGVKGYHEYKDVWSTPSDGGELSCERESQVIQEIH